MKAFTKRLFLMTLSLMMILSCITFQHHVYADTSLENVALNKSVYVYPSASGDPQLIVDGDTRYEYTRKTNVIPFLDVAFDGSNSLQDENEYYYREDSYVIVDLGASYVLDSLKIFDFDNTSATARDYTYSVALCNDETFTIENQADANWVHVGRTPTGLRTCVTDFNLSQKQVARYIKLYDLRVYGATSFAMTELQAFGIEASNIDAVKAYATETIDTYRSDIVLSDAETEAKNTIVSTAKNDIASATDTNVIVEVLNTAMTNVDTVLTLAVYKNEKINELNNYKADDRLFSDADNATQAQKLNEAIAQVRASSTQEEVDEIVATYQAEIDEFVVIANLALNKMSYASSQEANSVRPELAFDGNTTARESRWGSAKGSGPHWLYVDLGEIQDVRTVKVYWENRKPTNYSIQISNDASTWEDVQTFTSRPPILNDTIIFNETKQARYVRLYVNSFTEEDPDGGLKYNTVSLYEVEVYGIKLQDPETNVARGRNAYADSIEANSVREALGCDGDNTSTTSRWGSAKGAGPHWFYVDLGDQMDIRTIKVFWETRKATAYSIQVSDDAQEWRTIKASTERPTHLIERLVLDEVTQARYVRLYVDSFTADDPDSDLSWNTISIFELEVYGGVIKPTLEESLTEVKVHTPSKEDKVLTYTLPEVDENITLTYNGTDYEHVVDRDLTIYQPLVDTEVKVSFKAVNELTGKYDFVEIPVTIPGTYEVTSEDNPAPTILPELSEWKGSTGTFIVGDASKVVITDDSLQNVAEEFVQDYQDLFKQELSIVVGTIDDATNNDFYFSLTSDTTKGLKEEGYIMNIDDRIEVEAETTTGVYWATRTILQALKASGNGSIVKGMTRDYPMYAVRGVILDVGRKTFTLDYLKQVVKQMAWYKMNDFHVHLNDNYIWLENVDSPMDAYSGFRMESNIKAGDSVILGDEQKEFTYSADLTSKDVFYTKEDFRNFMVESSALGVNIIPEFDTPAHSLALTKVLPELRTSTSGRDNDHLDLAKQYDESYDFVTNIFDEYLLGENPVFPQDSVIHVGCDEYTAAPNAFRQFTNDMADYVESTGRTARIWGAISKIKGDGSVAVDGTGIQLDLWDEGYSDLYEMYELGFDIINCNDGDYYIVPNAGYYKDYLNTSTVYNLPINQVGAKSIPAGDEQMIGGAFAIWNDMCGERDNGISEYDVYVRMNKALPYFAAKLWGKQNMTQNQATEAINVLGDAPNTNFAYDLDDVTAEDYKVTSIENAEIIHDGEEKALSLKGGSSYATTGLETAGFDNTLKVRVKRTSENSDEQILLESSYGTMKAVQTGTGKVGITRENFDYSFNYTLPVGEWVTLEFRNKFEQVALYVNDTLVDTLGDDDKAGNNNRPMKATCMFPLAKIGSETNAFEGYVSSVTLNDVEILNYDADYSEVEKAIAQANALEQNDYEDFSAVTNAIEAVIYDLDITKQDEVDAMAQAIYDAIDALVEKGTLNGVQNVVATPTDYKTITLTWDAVTNATSYIVERLDTITNEWMEISQTSEPTYVHAGVKTGKQYTYRVKVMNDEVESEYSEEVSATTSLNSEVQLSIAANGTKRFDLSWTKVNGATRYIVYRKNGDGEWKKIITLDKDTTTYISKDMAPNTYAYQVKAARYDSIERVMTNGSNIVEGIIEPQAMVPTNVKAKLSDNAITITWDKVTGMTHYCIYRSANGGAYHHLKTTSSNTITNSSLKAGSTYQYKLRAYAIVNGEKVYSSEVELEPITLP